MANTQLKKKKKGVIGVNGLNNDAGKNDKLVTIWWGAMDNAQHGLRLFVWKLTSKAIYVK